VRGKVRDSEEAVKQGHRAERTKEGQASTGGADRHAQERARRC
jgi:hypothetical protein